MTGRSSRLATGLRQTVLTAGAVAGLLCIVVTLAALLFGLRPLVFMSGSMSPTIGTGALAISHQVPAGDLERGQIVSVSTPAGARVTHRIHAVERVPGAAILRLKGDANKVVDAAPYRVTHADVVLFHLPWVGYAVGWLTSPAGMALLGAYAAFLLSVLLRGPAGGGPRPGERRPDERRPAGGRPHRVRTPWRRRAGRSGAVVPLLVVAAVSGLVLQHRSASTLASWTDTPSVTGTTQQAYTVPSPPNTTCTVVPGTTSLRGVDLTWPRVTAVPLTYDVTVSGVATTPPTAPTVDSSLDPNTLSVRYDPSAVAADAMVTVTAVARPTGVASWTAPPTTWKFLTGHNQSSQPVCQEIDPPVLTVTAPTSTSTTVSAMRASVVSLCTKKRITCGTVSDASGGVVVQFRLQKDAQCWQDATASFTGDCTSWQPSIAAGTAWFNSASSNNLADLAYPSAGAYTFTVRATDSWGNVSTIVRSFTLTAG